MARRAGLGRGLSALIPEADGLDLPIPTQEVEIDLIAPNPHQPRTEWHDDRLAELAESIRQHGVIQPLLVSEERDPDGGRRYQLIAGERRLRAARAAGLERVPVTVRQTTPRELLELALVENVQRADLGPLEEAHAYRRLCDEFGLTPAEVGDRVGRSRSAIANTLRLLDLPAELHRSLAAGEISEGHARALLGLPDDERRVEAARRVVSEGLNVRQAERLVREWRDPPAQESPPQAAPPPGGNGAAPGAPSAEAGEHESGDRGSDTTEIEAALQRALGTRVQLRRGTDGQGSLTVHFYSDEELDGLLELLLHGDEL